MPCTYPNQYSVASYRGLSSTSDCAAEAQVILDRLDLAPVDYEEAIRQYSERCRNGEGRGVTLIHRILYALECENVCERHVRGMHDLD